MKEYTNVFTIWNINIIGGVESWLYYIAKKYSDRDITIFYGHGDPEQIDRLRHYVRVIRYDGRKIKCKRVFFPYGFLGIDTIDAEEYIFCVHADYKLQNINVKLPEKITRYIAVSETAKRSFEEKYNVPVELFYNPILLDEPRRVLHLISATRLTAEKGYARMIKLAEALKEKDIPYKWDVYTYDQIDEDLFTKCKPRLDIIDFIADADYLVQLSDSEASCYSQREALALGVPCICTDLETFRENGLEHGVNGFILPLDMSDIPVEKIYNHKFPKKHIIYVDKWQLLLGDEKSTYNKKDNPLVTVKILQSYRDIELNRMLQRGDRVEMTFKRALYIESLGYGDIEDDT